MEHLWNAWPEIKAQLDKARTILFLCDFDGTLTPIMERPEIVQLSSRTRELLSRLSEEPRFQVGIISGRALSDLKEKVQLEGIIYAGNHGFEVEAPGLSFISPIAEEIRPFFRVLRQVLNLAVSPIKGVHIEDKGLSLSVHYRQVDESRIGEVENRVKQSLGGPFKHLFKISPGKKVFDIQPSANWDKGKAIRLLMRKFGKGGRLSGLLPVYLGDDFTDESGFEVIEKYGQGISVHIGDDKSISRARYFLRSPREVEVFISRIFSHQKIEELCQQYLIQ